MKTQTQVENKWRDWVKALGRKYLMPQPQIHALQQAIAKEVSWYLMVPDAAVHLPGRLSKYRSLAANDKVNVQDYDRFFQYKIEFFEWVLN